MKEDTLPRGSRGPGTQSFRTLVPKAMNGVVFGARCLKYWVLGPSGLNYLEGSGELVSS